MVVKDWLVSQEDFTVVECANCTHGYTQDRVVEPEVGPYYDHPDYISHQDQGKDLLSTIYKRVRSYSLQQKSKLVERFVKGGKLLDYGCGTGAFLHQLDPNKWEKNGVEINDDARAKAGQHAQVNKEMSLGQSYDAITMWHVLEHIYAPVELLSTFRSAISDHGRLVVAVPNYKSYDAKHYKAHWAAYDVPIHVHHFSKESMDAIAAKTGWTVETTKPMWFDSVYISLLSEKYRSGASKPTVIHWLKAFVIGMLSNIHKAGKNTSSIIYILKPV